jgi:iron complex transport system permease protein
VVGRLGAINIYLLQLQLHNVSRVSRRLPTPSLGESVRARAVGWTAALSALLFATVVVSATVGPVDLGFLTVAKALAGAVALPVPTLDGGQVRAFGVAVSMPVGLAWHSPVAADVPETARIIVVRLRMDRIALGAVVGFALATAGVVMQGFFRNPMADPSVIGVSSGAAVGAVATIVAPVALPGGLPTAAFVGAVLTAGLVYGVATRGGRTPVATLLLAGIAVQTFLGAVVSYLLVTSGRGLREAVYWLMGHLSNATYSRVLTALPVALLGFVVVYAHAEELNALLLGEDDAAAVGVEVERTKRVLLVVSSVVTGAAVAVSGVIGFVGLVVPHVMRLLVGPDHRVLIPTSAVAGAAFLVAADTVARSGVAELPVGIVTAVVGAPFFLYLLRSREVHSL